MSRRRVVTVVLLTMVGLVPHVAARADYAFCGRADPWTGTDGPGRAERLVRTADRTLVLDGFTARAVDDAGVADPDYGTTNGTAIGEGLIGATNAGELAWATSVWDEQTGDTGLYQVTKGDVRGKPVAMWAGDGTAEFAPPNPDELVLGGVTPLRDGRVVVAFQRQPIGVPGSSELYVLGADGTLDTGFDGDGSWSTAGGISHVADLGERGIGLVAGGDGNTHLVVLDEQGSATVDVTFPYADVPSGPFSDRLWSTADGGLRLASEASGEWRITTLSGSGELDPSWGTDGVAILPDVPTTAVPVSHEGGVVFSWLGSVDGEPGLLARRLDQTGAPDARFAGDGTFEVQRAFGGGGTRVVEPAVGPGGDLYLAYAYERSFRRGTTIWRLHADGTLDSDCVSGINNSSDGPLARTRIAGADRFETAARLVGSVWASSDTVYVATGENFPDALAGTQAAIADEAPILLTGRDHLPTVTRTRLVALAPSRIVLLGGPAAVSDAVVDELADVAPIERVAGADRYETAGLLARRAFPDGTDQVFIATGAGFADALAAGPAAAANDTAVLLTAPTSLPVATRQALAELSPSAVYLIGGFGAVGPQVEEQLRDLAASAGFAVGRIAGFDRYQTMRELVATSATTERTAHSGWNSWNHALIATGETFPDALAAGPVAGKLGASLVLVGRDSLSEYSREILASGYPRRLTVVGGTAAVSNQVEALLTDVGLGYRFDSYVQDAFPDRIEDGHVTGIYRDTPIPKRWDSCQPIVWQYNPDGEPADGLTAVRDAIAVIADASQIEFDYGGTSAATSLEELPQDGVQRLLVHWDGLLGDSAGEATKESLGNRWGTRSAIVLDNNGSPGQGYDPGQTPNVILHELGHAVGLAHVGSKTSIMYPLVSDVARLSPGDQTGLQRLGGCTGR